MSKVQKGIQIGDRVVTTLNLNPGVASFGCGMYEGEYEIEPGMFKRGSMQGVVAAKGLPVARVRLADGQFVYGCECSSIEPIGNWTDEALRADKSIQFLDIGKARRDAGALAPCEFGCDGNPGDTCVKCGNELEVEE